MNQGRDSTIEPAYLAYIKRRKSDIQEAVKKLQEEMVVVQQQIIVINNNVEVLENRIDEFQPITTAYINNLN